MDMQLCGQQWLEHQHEWVALCPAKLLSNDVLADLNGLS